MAVRLFSLSSCTYLLFMILTLITDTNLRIDVQIKNVVTTNVTSKPFRSRGFNTSRVVYYTNATASFQLARIKQRGGVNPNPCRSSLEIHETNSDEIPIQARKGQKIGHWNVQLFNGREIRTY